MRPTQQKSWNWSIEARLEDPQAKNESFSHDMIICVSADVDMKYVDSI